MWTDGRMDTQGEWFSKTDINEGSQPKMDTKLYLDMRNPLSETWIPPLSILDVNFTTDGCLEITPNGLFNTRVKEECNNIQPSTCKYTGESLLQKSIHGLQVFWSQHVQPPQEKSAYFLLNTSTLLNLTLHTKSVPHWMSIDLGVQLSLMMT